VSRYLLEINAGSGILARAAAADIRHRGWYPPLALRRFNQLAGAVSDRTLHD
jgi:hypothetical protein